MLITQTPTLLIFSAAQIDSLFDFSELLKIMKFQNFQFLIFFVGARKPLFSRIYNYRHDGLPSCDLMVVSVVLVSGNFWNWSVWQKITLCEYLSQTPADEKWAQLSVYDQFLSHLSHPQDDEAKWWVRTIHCCHARLKCQNAYTRVSIWIWFFHIAGSGSGSDFEPAKLVISTISKLRVGFGEFKHDLQIYLGNKIMAEPVIPRGLPEYMVLHNPVSQMIRSFISKCLSEHHKYR